MITRSRPVRTSNARSKLARSSSSVQARVRDADRVGERLRFLIGLAGDFAVEREQVVRLSELLRFEDFVFAGL